MNKKICFFDVDGTLTDERMGPATVIPKSTIQALNKARDAGILLFVNTGRPFSTVPQAVKDLPMDGFICGCGTWIMMHGKELYRYEIPKEKRIQVMHTVDDLKLCCVYEAKEGYGIAKTANHSRMKRIIAAYEKEGFPLLEVNDDFVFEKFCFFKENDEPWPDLSFVQDYDQFYKPDFFCELVPNDCSKGKAIQFLMDTLGIPLENSYGFADSENDVEMLKVVHHSTVMAHAPQEVLEMADYVTQSPSEDGLYNAMVHLGLIKE